jgi:hypothetical protein
MELSADGPFLVTFTRRGFIPITIPVRIEPTNPGGSQAKLAPNPVFAALEHTHETKPKPKPPRTAAARSPTPTEASEATSNDGLVVRSWRYVEQKTQDWETQLVKLVRGGGSR